MRLAAARVSTVLPLLLFATMAPAQWMQTNGPYVGPFFAFAVMDRDSGASTILAGAAVGRPWAYGVFRSTDGGMQWEVLSDGSPSGWVYAFLVRGETVLASTVLGLFRSTDSGTTWSTVYPGLPSHQIHSLAAIDTVLFAGTTTDGVLRSTDNGDHWSQLPATSSEQVLALAVRGRDLFFVGGLGGVRRSSDFGDNWVRVSNGLEQAYLVTIAMGDTAVYVGGGGGVFRTRDNGATWTSTTAGLPPEDSVQSLALLGTGVFAGTTDGVYRLADTSTHWLPVNIGLSSRHVVRLLATDSILLASTYNGSIFRSTNRGATWAESSTGLATTEIPALLFHDSTLFAGTQSGLWPGNGAFCTTDAGDHWESLRKTLPDQRIVGIAAIAEENGDTNYYAGGDRLVYQSTDKGATWNPLPRGPTEGTAFARMGRYLIVGCGGEGIFRTSDNGLTWDRSFPAWRDEANRITDFAVIDSLLFAATEDGLYYSIDTGASWIGSSLGVSHVFALALIPKKAGHGVNLFAGAPLWIYRSTDSGATWTDVHEGLRDTWVTGFVAAQRQQNPGTNLFASSYDGVFLSSDDGTTWTDVSEGLTERIVQSLALNGTYLFAGTRGSGVWRRPLAEMVTSAASDANTVPVDFALQQNYPNPFNPKTIIKSQLPVASDVRLVVYDLLGREVAVLVSARRTAGTYQDTFDGSRLSSGMYLCRLTAWVFSATRRMLLIK